MSFQTFLLRNWYISAIRASSSSNATSFLTPYGDIVSGTEINMEMRATEHIHIRRITTMVSSNNKDESTIIGLNADGVTVASLTIIADATGVLDSGEISGDINIGQDFTILWDTSASSEGTIAVRNILGHVTS